MSRGATITEILAPDRNGKLADVVLGFDNVAGYESKDNQYFGCTTGRVCNRIAKGQFTLDGQTYQLARNDNDVNHLHGGLKRNLDKLVWAGEKVVTPQGVGVRFKVVSPDGDEGYPGTLTVTVTYVLSDLDALWIEYGASTDKNTPVNLTNHSYFNLAGAGEPSVLDHELMVSADEYTPVDDTLIPTGKIESVAGTPLDFRQPTKIGARIEALVNTPTKGYDHNFVLTKRQEQATLAAKLKDPASGRVLTLYTTQPGLQVYSGNFLVSQPGKGGKLYPPRSAVCLETQHFPDSVNQPTFPSIVIKPNQPYKQTTVFAFSAE
jgi:aldose 1-epimerase